MSTAEEPPEWVTGPPADYDPPPLDDLIDPEIREQAHSDAHAKGRRLCLTALAEQQGITKRDDGKWDTPNTTDRGARA
jgi:hypothetical protein